MPAKNVILIGDSIREGYQATVRELLEPERVAVWSPEENCRHSRYVLEHLDEWVLSRRPDLVHLNCGLHDLQYMHDLTRQTVPIAEFEANVRRIFEQIQEHGINLIWATITPINEQWYNCKPHKRRFEADVLAYNECASKIARERQVPINDLYRVAMAAGRDQVVDPDGVHLNLHGYDLAGRAVSTAILEAL
jgi:lysophospholipase L1-like esterase